MDKLESALIILVMGLMIASCGTTDADYQDGASLLVTAGINVPEGLMPAVIFEIDGEPVWYNKSQHWLEAGEHTVRVVPAPYGALTAEPDIRLVTAIRSTDSKALTLAVEPGQRYWIVAREIPAGDSYWETGTSDLVASRQRTIVPAVLLAMEARVH